MEQGSTSDGARYAQSGGSKKIQQTQAQVDEVVGIMRVNVEKVLERDQKLSELDSRADALNAGAQQFEQHATKLKRKYWWKNMKMMLIMGGLGALLLIIIIIWVSSSFSGGDSSDEKKPSPSPSP